MYKENKQGNRSSLSRRGHLKETAGQFCSPVKEEDEDGTFTSDLAEVERMLSSKDSLKEMAPPTRRQTTIGGRRMVQSARSSARPGRLSIGANNSRKQIGSRRMSLGANTHHLESENKTIAEMSRQLQDQSKKRFHQKNVDEIRYRELLTKHRALEAKSKKEIESLKAQIHEYKRQNKRLQYNVKRLQSQMSKRQNNESEKFAPAKDVFNSKQKFSQQRESRRYSINPADLSRKTETSAGISTTESHYIKVENLAPGTNSQSLLKLCAGYGDIAQLRVMKDIVRDTLKGYVTFVEPSYAQRAVEGLQARGFAASLTESC